MPLTRQREKSPIQGERAYKKVKNNTLEIYYTLKDAKHALHNTINQDLDYRIYQIEQWNYDFSRLNKPFVVGTFTQICENYILDRDIHENIMEYLFGDERCSLVFDIEWYYPTPMTLSELEEHICEFVIVLVTFISMAVKRDDRVCITSEDVCIEQACDMKKRKASFHVKVPNLVFGNMAYEMQNFVFYFCTWMYENRDSICKKIPEIFFHQTKRAKEMIKDFIGDDLDKFLEGVKVTCEEEWRRASELWYMSCGVDTGIYSRGRAFRMAGVCKPNKQGEMPRFLRPCLVTGWWEKKLTAEYLNEEVIRMEVPPKEYRRVWARASLLMVPAPPAINIKVPLPQGAPWKEPWIDSEYNVLPRPSRIEMEWQWRLNMNTDRYAYPKPCLQIYHPGPRVPVGDVAPMDIDIEGDAGSDGFIYLLEDGKLRLYERRDGRWYNKTDDAVCVDIEQRKAEAFARIHDDLVRYWNDLIDMKLRALGHMEESEHDLDMNYTQLQGRYESAKQISKYISILYIDERTRDLMFTAPNVTLDSRFQLITAKGQFVRLGEIDRKTRVYCPRHEIDNNFRTHKASAFVGINRLGRRFVHCSSCGGSGRSIRETRCDGAREETWNDFNDLYGDARVRFIDRSAEDDIRKRFLTTDDLLWFDDDDDNRSADSIARSRPGPLILILHAPMGAGKTTALEMCIKEGAGVIMEPLGKNATQQLSVLSISPKRDLAQFTAEMLGLVAYTDENGMVEHWRRWHGNAPPPKGNALWCAQRRLSICIKSLRRLTERDEGYDIIVLDEYPTTVMFLISKLMLQDAAETMEILRTLIEKAKVVIMVAADGTPRMVKTILPFVDWEDPRDVRVTIFKGGVGGISGHGLYVSDDLNKVCRVLKKYVQEGKSVYVPTNYREFAENLVEFCKGCLGLSGDEIMFYHQGTSKGLKKEIIRDPEWRLGHVDRPSHPKSRLEPYPKVRVFIATPAFGVGFSVKGGLFDVTIAFFFTYPLTVPGNIQHLARIRGVKEKEIICFYQSRQSKKETFIRKMNNEQTHLENAIRSYEDLIKGINPAEFNRLLPKGQLRAFAIHREVQNRLSEWYADSMFIDAVRSSTQTVPHLLDSWICNKGAGPVKVLPDLTDAEASIIRRKDNSLDIAIDAPETWPAMRDLWARQAYGADLTKDEVEFVKVFEELPVPYNLLKEHERRPSFVCKLDHIWYTLEVATAGNMARLLELDFKKYVRSQGVAIVYQGGRHYQKYQLFEAWARLLVPCLPEVHQRSSACDAGIEFFSFLASQWRWKNLKDTFHFDLSPENFNFKEAVDDIEDTLNELHECDARVKDWINTGELEELISESEDGVSKTYANIVRRGLRQLLGRKNVKVKKQKNGMVRVKVVGLRRLITLACVRRINMECDIVVTFCKEKFSIVSKFRGCLYMTGLVPSDKELEMACGMDV